MLFEHGLKLCACLLVVSVSNKDFIIWLFDDVSRGLDEQLQLFSFFSLAIKATFVVKEDGRSARQLDSPSAVFVARGGLNAYSVFQQ